MKLLTELRTAYLAEMRRSVDHGKIIRVLYLVVFLVFIASMVRLVNRIWVNGGTTTVLHVSNGDTGEIRSTTDEIVPEE